MPAASSLRSQLLRSAVPLVKDYGFTREALARSVLAHNDASLKEHKEPLSEDALDALFGPGNDSRRTLIHAWLDEGLDRIREMGRQTWEQQRQLDTTTATLTLGQVLHARLEYNEPALPYIPEAFALLISPSIGVPPLDPLPAIQHTANVADEACRAIRDQSLHLAWYTNRASIAAIYTAAELHQLTSPTTAHAFLDSLLESSTALKKSVDEIGTYSQYVIRSWAGIIKSSGIL
ncbi:hypothetical protein F5887DRAFT_1273488 [Amanita rubescens]|nr:hypothetical protein F5887DRAFT_1273488 [Amanita rubescens]